jgi:hypothetical protein
MTGEVIEAYILWQGGPVCWWFQYDLKKHPFHLLV